MIGVIGLPVLDNKGVAFYHLGNYTGAITYYNRALAIDPSVVFASYDKGNALEALENYSDAITYFDKALALIQITFLQ